MNAHPRSTLHALPPQGVGSSATESLLSYFCRLAVSHAVSTADLARFVVSQVRHDIRADFEWQQRNISGLGESARNWAAWLSALSGIGQLDMLTLSNWSGALPQRGIAAKRSHWCPQCLREDWEAGRKPYFRLSWEVGPVEACHRHKVELVDTCPHCGKRHVRHDAGIIVPGWCSKCGGFLGGIEAPPASPKQLWVARQVEDWIANQTRLVALPHADTVITTLNTLILALDGGQYARFAKRLGLAKSTVHSWLRKGGLPSLDAYLAIAGHTGLSLDQVIRGELDDWKPNERGAQLAMAFDLTQRDGHQTPRQHDWVAIQKELERMLMLPEPISVAEAGRRLSIDDRHLYLRANDLARAIGERWKQYQASRKTAHRESLRLQLRETLPAILEAGKAFNLNEIRHAVPASALKSVEGAFGLIREVREEFG